MVKLLHWRSNIRLDTSPGPGPHTLIVSNLPSQPHGPQDEEAQWLNENTGNAMSMVHLAG